MTFTKVNELPTSRSAKRNLKAYLQEFMAMNIKIVKVENHGYKTYRTAVSCIYDAIKRHCFPITVKCINKEIYLINREL